MELELKFRPEEMERRKRAISMLLLEVTGKEFEITDKIYSIYLHYSYEDLCTPLIKIMRDNGKSYGEISNKLGLKNRRVEYIVTGK